MTIVKIYGILFRMQLKGFRVLKKFFQLDKYSLLTIDRDIQKDLEPNSSTVSSVTDVEETPFNILNWASLQREIKDNFYIFEAGASHLFFLLIYPII